MPNSRPPAFLPLLRLLLVALALPAGLLACGDPDVPPTVVETGGKARAEHPILGEAPEAVLDLGGSLARPPLGDDLEAWAEAARAVADAREIAVDYPLADSVFPPDFAPPTFLWQDDTEADTWLVTVTFAAAEDASIVALVPYAAPPAYEIDERTIGSTNEVYQLTPHQASAKAWTPSPPVWEAIKRRSRAAPATVTFTGMRGRAPGIPLSRGAVSIRTSADPVGAPIFYRDVPLMPDVGERGAIQPLSKGLLPLIAWRLRDVSKPRSRLLLTDMPSCGNCHSFSADGTIFGMDVDGPSGDKGTYALLPVEARMSIDPEDLITWNSFPDKLPGHKTIGFLSRVSPTGRYVISTVNEDLYIANFTDFRYLQVFFPVGGILACYDSKTGRMKALPGADDPAFVHSNGVWTPDGKEIIFSRAKSFDLFEHRKPKATRPNDPNEPQIRYDLYRLPFNEGRGGTPEPIEGASDNGMSNTFPKVSPDGKWIVFVQCKNGQLMRPDGRLWIVPVAGGTARKMTCNTESMNSWHSFSPNSRWLVFSSKVNRPYTQMFLTHIDEDGNDTPPILIPHATADNRAVNLPEFLNAPPDALQKIEVPAIEHRRSFIKGIILAEEGKPAQAMAYFRKSVELDPEFTHGYLQLGMAQVALGRIDEGIRTFERILELEPMHAATLGKLGAVLLAEGRKDEARHYLGEAVEYDPTNRRFRELLGGLLFDQGLWEEALPQYEMALNLDVRRKENHRAAARIERRLGHPSRVLHHLEWILKVDATDLDARTSLAWVLATTRDDAFRDGKRALGIATEVVMETGQKDAATLDVLAAALAEVGRTDEAAAMADKALRIASRERSPLAEGLRDRALSYRAGRPWRE